MKIKLTKKEIMQLLNKFQKKFKKDYNKSKIREYNKYNKQRKPHNNKSEIRNNSLKN